MKAEGRRQSAEGRTFSLLHSLKPHRFSLALLTLLASLLFFAPLVKREAFSFRDHTDYFQPLRWFTAEELRAGRVPLWNPYNASGEPWLANPQTGVFYPPSWVFLVAPFATAYMLYLLFHVLLLGWSAYLLFVRSGSPGAAMVGAVALMLGGPTLSMLDVSNNLATFAWIPLVVWCALERAPIRGAFALALAFLAGEPFFAAVAAVMFVVASRRMRDIAIAGVTAFGLCAIQLLPFLAMLRGSDRARGLDGKHVLLHSMAPGDWLRLFTFPQLDENAFDPRLHQHFIPLIYVGVVVGALAAVGLVVAFRKKATWGWLALLAFAVVIGTGPAFVASMPLTLFRYPARLVPLAAMAIVAIAVAGWDRIRPNKRWVDLIVVLILATDLLARAKPLLETAPPGPHRVLYGTDVGVHAKILRVGEMPPEARTSWVSGYLNLYQWRFDAFTAAPVVDARYVEHYAKLLEAPAQADLQALPVGHVITTHTLSAPFTRDVRVGRVNVYRFPRALPMARIDDGTATLDVDTSHAYADVDARAAGTLVVALRDGLGWRATVDGKKAEKLSNSWDFLSVAVPRGRHRVEFVYRPAPLFVGASMTLITLALLSIFLLVKRSRGEFFFFLSHKK